MADSLDESVDTVQADGADDIDMDGDLIFISEEKIELDDHGNFANSTSMTADTENGADVHNDLQDTEDNDGGGEDEKIDDRGGSDDKAAMKEEGLMVVDEWDDEVAESDLEDDEDFSLGEKDESALNPEDHERSLLSMPAIKLVLDEIGHLKKNRRVVAQQIKMEDLDHPKLREVVALDTCEEVKVHFIRPKEDEGSWTGIAVLNFTTNGSATMAMEELKMIRDDLEIKLETNTNQTMEQFAKNGKNDKRWTDNVLLVKNLVSCAGDEAKMETQRTALREIFPSAEEIIIHKEPLSAKQRKEKDGAATATTSATSSTGTSIPRGYGYLVYRNNSSARAILEEFEGKKAEIDGHRLDLLLYRPPTETIPRGLLKLRERRLLMRHVDKLTNMIEHTANDPSAKLPENVSERLETCKALIERDNRSRKEISLPTPSLEEIRLMKGLPILTAADNHRLLVRLGVIEDKPKPHVMKPREDTAPRKPSGRGGYSGRGRGRDGNQTRRSSPPGFKGNISKRGSWGGRGRRPLLEGPSGRNMMANVNPLALMMQQNMGLLGNASMMNPSMNLLMQPGMGMLAANSLMGSLPASATGNIPFMGGGLSSGGGRGLDDHSGSGKILRLDETGNYRESEASRYRRERDRYDMSNRSRDRDDRTLYHDVNRSRHRSRTPPDSRPRGSRDLYDSGMSGGRGVGDLRGGVGASADNPVAMLLNLSQMLSEKMEQKRVQMDRMDRDKRGPYGRSGDYRSGQR